MSAWDFSPGITYRQDLYMQQSGQALANALSQFAQEQKIKQQQAELDQRELTKNQVIMNHLSGLTDAQGQPVVDPQDMLEFNKAVTGGNVKKASDISSGILSGVAADQILQKQRMSQPGLTYLPPPQGAPPGVTGRVIRTGEGHDITPFTPTPGLTQMPDPAHPGQTIPVPYVTNSAESATLFPGVGAPPPEPYKLENGQWVVTDANGKVTLSAAPPKPDKEAEDSWAKADGDLLHKTGATFNQWNNAQDITADQAGNVSATVIDRDGKSARAYMTKAEYDTFRKRMQKIGGAPPAPVAAGQPIKGASADVTDPNYQNAASAITAAYASGQMTREEAKAELAKLGIK